ncbi:MAG: nicotinate-nucleotide adenylyltransferase [Flavobacteriales bacterium]|nr:nicotinate-nucleotide adenylyltransferase [Flavobacteriales bacterium]
MKIGLYFGTFNPVHIGHMIIANHMVENTDLDEVWMVVTPHNPHKKKKTLLDDHQRYEMVFRAAEAYDKIKPSNIEFGLDQPNYTVNTLMHIQEKYPNHEFCLLMGEDNLWTFHKWKNHEFILEHHELYVYPRFAEQPETSFYDTHKKVNFVKAPIIEISSTHIRTQIKERKNIRPLLPPSVWEYIDHNNFYR